MPLTETDIANLALDKLGAQRITVITETTTKEGIKANLHYAPTRDALLRSHSWRFASGRIRLVSAWATATAYTTDQYVWSSSLLYKCIVAHTSTTAGAHDADNVTDWVLVTARPDFEYDYQYDLPADFIRLNGLNYTDCSYELEGLSLLTDDDNVDLLYVKKVTDPTKFDPLFVEVLALHLAIELVMPLAQDKTLADRLESKAVQLMARVRTVDKQETNTLATPATWNQARL